MAMTFSFSSSGVLVILSTDALIQLGGGRLWLFLQILHEIINSVLDYVLRWTVQVTFHTTAVRLPQHSSSSQIRSTTMSSSRACGSSTTQNFKSMHGIVCHLHLGGKKNHFTQSLRGRDAMVPLDCLWTWAAREGWGKQAHFSVRGRWNPVSGQSVRTLTPICQRTAFEVTKEVTKEKTVSSF